MFKEDKRFMRKEYVYALFTLKFVASISLIYWTVATVLESDVGKDADDAFLTTYHKVDKNYNNMIISNQIFSNKYNIKFIFNNQAIQGISLKDIYLGQRSIQKRKKRKNMLKVGENKITILVEDKKGDVISNKIVDMMITKNNTHTQDVKLKYQNKDTKSFIIQSQGYWNIDGTVEVQGDKGFFYIKTNAKKES